MLANSEPRLIELDSVSVRFGGFTALESISCEIEPGETVAIVGPSGSGKTTLLRVLSGAVQPFSGKVSRQERLGIVYQDAKLLPWLTVLQNIELGLDASDTTATLAPWIEAAGLAEKLKSFPYELSGGQRQRAAVVRALARDPQVLLLDEPFSALDFVAKQRLTDLIRRVVLERRLTMITVTHDLRDAVKLAGRILVLRRGQLISDLNLPQDNTRNVEALEREIESYFNTESSL